jgi:hypothetical protein
VLVYRDDICQLPRGTGRLGKSKMSENIHEKLFRPAEHFDLQCACGRFKNFTTSSEETAERWRKIPTFRCENCLQNKILEVRPLPFPVDNELWVDLKVSCSSCAGSESVRLTDSQWAAVRQEQSKIEPLICAKCLDEKRYK